MSRTVAEELWSYINAAHVECVKIISSDDQQFDVPSVFLCARSKTLELMIHRMKDGEWAEGKVKALSLPEDGELIDAFLTALRYDSVPWVKFLKCELTRPGSVPATIKKQTSEYFSPLIQSPLGHRESAPVPFKQVLLGRILDLLGMAHKYEFEALVHSLENALQSVKAGLWDTPIQVLGILRMALMIESQPLQISCKEALQNLRGGDLLAWLNPDPLQFWTSTRKLRICVVSPIGECFCRIRVALSDTIFYLKEYLTANYQADLLGFQNRYKSILPSVFILQHRGLSLDSRKTLEECQVSNEDQLRIRFIKRLLRNSETN
eukprot:Protomagalhaensia_wolfi_Nauph_80__5474@NODE_599_length_2229_cov_9_790411_g449_i0_p1_GENE_NODE_599_length_2229_cov_9_790411_g449_i0NODE_599_length_2229_cov_9_790411_g449_i0_p1_ORF_typecomplete_len321_score28_96BTB/PF00651_31/0_0044Skp1_POZ/PF03931_15/0_023ubiquitin/PF00240_23/0_045_NODE_599_length_2229_cov_9_790411_g449_i02511213